MGDLLKQLDLRGLSWRALFLCGVLPAVLLFGVADSLCANLGTFLSDFNQPQKYWSLHASEVIALLVLTGLFTALRSPIFGFYRGMRIPGLHSLLLGFHAAGRGSAELKKQEALWRITVARWYERDFSPNVFVAESVRESIQPPLPAEAVVQIACRQSRNRVASSKFYDFWIDNVNRSLGWLFCMAAMRYAVAKRASDIARATPGNSDAANWTTAETQLGFQAPGQWVLDELTEWRQLYASSVRAKGRIEALNRYQLNDQYARAYQRAENYPAAEWIEATAIGNSMAALEDYSNRRYGVDTSLLWSRLEKVIPKEQREEVAASQIAVQALLNCSAALTLAGVAAFVLPSVCAWFHPEHARTPPGQWKLHILLFCVAASLAWIFHGFATYAARQLRSQIESRIDLYLPRWLAAVGLVPKDTDERKRMIAAMGAFAAGSSANMPNFALQPITDPALSFEKSK